MALTELTSILSPTQLPSSLFFPPPLVSSSSQPSLPSIPFVPPLYENYVHLIHSSKAPQVDTPAATVKPVPLPLPQPSPLPSSPVPLPLSLSQWGVTTLPSSSMLCNYRWWAVSTQDVTTLKASNDGLWKASEVGIPLIYFVDTSTQARFFSLSPLKQLFLKLSRTKTVALRGAALTPCRWNRAMGAARPHKIWLKVSHIPLQA
ncbi:hypothetical protein AMTR_s00158p00073620 [Amborella trichopoda]|uniref:Uncharacterized protein n=1 Tax=Amborella trichopoda TaxID=13333 RepID=W1PSD1_AMBTC|nr:hypothetical protein AMTR_s00158p00073620 [Amborella trichopoda]